MDEKKKQTLAVFHQAVLPTWNIKKRGKKSLSPRQHREPQELLKPQPRTGAAGDAPSHGATQHLPAQGIGRGLGTLQHELIHPCLLLPHARGPDAPAAGTQAPQLPKNLEAPALARLWSCPGGTSGASQVCFRCLFQGSFSKCSQIRTLRLACEVFCPRGKAGQEDGGLSRLAKLPHSPESYYQPQISL